MRDKSTPDERLAELAGRQHGVVGVGQLAPLGVDRRAVARRVAAGWLCRVHRGVYAVGRAPLSREGRWLAAVLACGECAALSYASAGALWGIRSTASARIDVTVPRGSGRRSNSRIRVHRPLEMPETTMKDGIRVTTPTQTLIDLSSVLPRPALERAIEAAEKLRLLDVDRLPPKLATLARAVEPELRSPLEALFLDLCRDHGLPRPRVNTVVEAFEVDFCWPDARLIVETDGHRHHATRGAFERDRARDAALTAAGWRVVRITHRRLVERPAEVAGLLRRLLSARSPSLATP
jgi:very-short-patch-repair endonuclease